MITSKVISKTCRMHTAEIIEALAGNSTRGATSKRGPAAILSALFFLQGTAVPSDLILIYAPRTMSVCQHFDDKGSTSTGDEISTSQQVTVCKVACYFSFHQCKQRPSVLLA